MLNRIIAFCLRNRILVVAAALVIAIVGSVMAARLPIDVLPDLNRPTVTILTEAHGMAPEDVEQLVTRHIERSVSGAPGVVRVRSSSGMQLSVVYVEFDWGTDLYLNRQIVQERLAQAIPELPEETVPQMAPVTSLLGQVQLIGMRSRTGATSPTELSTLAAQVVRLRLLTVKGVSNVITSGGAPLQLQAILSADDLRANGVALHDVAEGLREANHSASGGFLPMGPEAPLITIAGRAQTAADLARAVIRADPIRPLRVEDVGTVSFGPSAIRTGSAGIDGGPGVVLVLLKQPGMDTVELTRRVDAEIASIRESLPDDIEILPGLYRQSDFIERAITNVEHAVRDGAIFVLIVLVVFLLNFRTTLITLTAIPLSVAVTALVFYWTGVSINTMTLGGLAVAVGALVDDAIVDVENVFRRLKQNQALEKPRNPLVVVFRASSEVRGPILVGTIVVAAVYLPLFALHGMEGRLFTPIGVAYIVSIVASLFVALTVTPVMCAYLLPKSKAITAAQDGWLVRRLRNGAEHLIRLSLARPIPIAGTVAVLVVTGLAVLGSRGSEFLPEFNEGSAQANLILPPETSLETSDRYGTRAEQVVGAVDGVLHVTRKTGRASGDEHAHDVNMSMLVIAYDPESTRTREAVIADIRRALTETFPGAASYTEQPIAHALSHLLSGVNAQVAIKISGEDLAVLRAKAAEVEAAIRDVPGVTDLVVEQQVLVRQVEVKPDRSALARYGLTVHDIAETVELALEGAHVDRISVGQLSYPVVVRLRAEDRLDLDAIGDLLIPSGEGPPARIADVARVRIIQAPNFVNHENMSRRIVVQHNVEGRSLGEVVRDVNRALDPIRAALPVGYSIRISGQFEAQAAAQRTILWLSLLSLGVMFLVLYVHFRSGNLAIQTLLKIPSAFIGAAFFLWITDQTLSIATLVGFVALGGIASRNGILLIDHYLHLMKEEGLPFSHATLIQAGRERVVPVLMTALTSGIALVPILLTPDAPGRELLYPVASVIVGGLVTTTLLDLLLTPGVFWLFGRRPAEAHVQRIDPGDEVVEALARSLELETRLENPS